MAKSGGPRGNPNWAKDPKTGKGKSGNPGGRPQGYAEFRSACQAETEASLAILVKWRDQDRDGKTAVAAALAILDRAWGKPCVVDANGETVRDQVIQVVIPEALKRDA